jgi:hypothetical protein
MEFFPIGSAKRGELLSPTFAATVADRESDGEVTKTTAVWRSTRGASCRLYFKPLVAVRAPLLFVHLPLSKMAFKCLA